MRKRTPSGASTEKPLPRPGTTSTVRWVCFQYSYWETDIQKGMVRSRPGTSRSASRMSASEVMKSPSGKNIGDDPSQQPPDWWNISGPCLAVRVASISAAALLISTRFSSFTRLLPFRFRNADARARTHGMGAGPPPLLRPAPRLEEPELLRRVAHQQVLRLLVVVKHHLVVLAADTGLLVPAERGVRRVGVVAVRPDPACLDLPAGPVGP